MNTPEPDEEWSEEDRAALAALFGVVGAARAAALPPETEPQMRQRLANRRARLARLEALGAPGVILEENRRLVRQYEDKLGEPPGPP